MKRLLLILLTIALVLTSAAKPKKPKVRSSEKVRQEQRDTRKRIKKTESQISANTAKTRKGLKQLDELEADIAVRQEGIDRNAVKIRRLTASLDSMADSVSRLEGNIGRLKTDYAESLRAMRRQRQTLNSVSYFFAAQSFAQAFRRMRYLRELGSWHSAKTVELRKSVAELKVQQERLDSSRRILTDEQAQQQTAQNALSRRRSEAKRLVDELKKEGSTLNQELRRQKRQLDELNAELDRAIAEEVRRAEEERKRKAAEEAKRKAAEEAKRKAAEEEARKKAGEEAAKATPGKNEKPVKPVEKPAEKPAEKKPAESNISFAETERKLTGSFESNKGKLLFPVAGKYTITGAYGNHTRPGTGVAVTNNGIDITTAAGASARAVFDGEVVSVFKVKGTGYYAVLLRHGRYITVYSKLSSYAVRNGQQVKSGQTIGQIFTDPESESTVLHFELRREAATQNPLEWVK